MTQLQSIDSLFNLAPEYALLRKTVREFVEREKVAQQAAEHDRNQTFNHQLFRKLAEPELNHVTIPELYNGSGLGAVGSVIVLEELSRWDPGFALSYLAHQLLCAHNLAVNGSESQIYQYLPALLSSEKRGGMGMTEPVAGTDVMAMRTTAFRDSNNWVLNGEKCFITNADGDVFLVYGKIVSEKGKNPDYKDRSSTFIVEKGFPGFKLEKIEHDKCGMRASPTGTLRFDDCMVPLENLVGNEGSAVEGMMRNLEIERVGLAAMSIGIATQCYQYMHSHSRTRKTFGRTLDEHGQIKRLLAESFAELDAARTQLYATALRIDPEKQVSLYADATKLFATAVGERVSRNALQILAGMGYCGHPVQQLWRDAPLLSIGGGTNEAMHNNIVKYLAKHGLPKI